MAMYHFRLKSDKKPNEMKIAAVKHVEYIRREGAYTEHADWQVKTKFVGNLITTAETLNHQLLILHGSSEFQQSVVNAAAQDDLKIQFADPLIQSDFNHRNEEIENDQRKFVARGGIVITKRPKFQSITAPTHAQTIESATESGFSVPTLSGLAVIHPEAADVLLSTYERGELDAIAKDSYSHVRWDFSGQRTSTREGKSSVHGNRVCTFEWTENSGTVAVDYQRLHRKAPERPLLCLRDI